MLDTIRSNPWLLAPALVLGGLLAALFVEWIIFRALRSKDSLANLFAGIFILADAPYRLGDYVVLDQGLRGKVTHIGIRSTRVLTLDDIEITVPNSIIGNSTIINETAGPQKTRLRVAVSCAYGSDVDHVRQVLLRCANGIENIATDPTPVARFRSFGDSGLNFELLFWIHDGRYRGIAIDLLNDRIYKAFAQAKIEIPFPKRDLYIKQHASA